MRVMCHGRRVSMIATGRGRAQDAAHTSEVRGQRGADSGARHGRGDDGAIPRISRFGGGGRSIASFPVHAAQPN